MNVTLGEYLLLCRRRKGLTQEDAAPALGVSHTTLSQWENDQTPREKIFSFFPELADLYDVSINELMNRLDGKSNETERALAKDHTLKNEQRDALLLFYEALTGRKSRENVVHLLLDQMPNIKRLNKSA